MHQQVLRHVRLLVVPSLLAIGACGGAGDAQPPSATVTIGGTITFDRIPFKAGGAGLDPAAVVKAPARQVTVEAIDASNGATLASTTTDAQGRYSVDVPADRRLFVRAKAQMVRTGAAPTWRFSVRNNTNAGALYALEGTAFDSGTSGSTHDLHAASGWGTTGYVDVRSAAPFAILDTVYEAKALLLSTSQALDFPALDLYWSEQNRNVVDEFCPKQGSIGTSFYVGAGAQDQCAAPDDLPAGIYILGAFDAMNGDTDEFDPHVLAHEFGHYVEDQFSRADSGGGEHLTGDRLDLRLAFGEGWGNAYAAMALNDPGYRDSFQGFSAEFGFDLEAGDLVTGVNADEAKGWFSEFSIGRIVWDLFDGDAQHEGSQDDDEVALEFAPLFAVMRGEQRTSDAFASIFSFVSAVRAGNPSASGAIDNVLAGELIDGRDAFATGESHDGDSPTALPVYTPIGLNEQTAGVLCTSAKYGDGNKLGYSRFLRLDLDARANVVITVKGAPDPSDVTSVKAIDPNIYVHHRGVVVASAESDDLSAETLPQQALEAGTYVVEVLDFALPSGDTTPHCMTVSVSGG